MPAPSVWDAIGQALMAGSQNADQQRKLAQTLLLQQQARQDQLNQEGIQNNFRRQELAGQDQDRQMRILNAAIDGAGDQEIPQSVVDMATRLGQQGRLQPKQVGPTSFAIPNSDDIPGSTSVTSLDNPASHTGYFATRTPEQMLADAKAKAIMNDLAQDNQPAPTPSGLGQPQGPSAFNSSVGPISGSVGQALGAKPQPFDISSLGSAPQARNPVPQMTAGITPDKPNPQIASLLGQLNLQPGPTQPPVTPQQRFRSTLLYGKAATDERYGPEKAPDANGDVPPQAVQNIISSGLSGDDLFKTVSQIDPRTASNMKLLAGYNWSLPIGNAMKDPYFSRVLVPLATAYDPSFDVKQFDARKKSLQDFTSGQSAQRITSANRLIQHLGVLQNAAQQLGNSDMPVLGAAINYGHKAYDAASGGNPNRTAFQEAAQHVQEEASRFFNQASLTNEGRSDAMQAINDVQSPAATRGAINSLLTLMQGQLSSLHDQYARNMGKSADFHFLAPESLSTLKALGANPEVMDPGGNGTAPWMGQGQAPGQPAQTPQVPQTVEDKIQALAIQNHMSPDDVRAELKRTGRIQ